MKKKKARVIWALEFKEDKSIPVEIFYWSKKKAIEDNSFLFHPDKYRVVKFIEAV